PAMQAVKNMAELTASRPVPVLMVGGPLDETTAKLKDSLGVVQVLDAPSESKALLDAISALVDKMEAARRESQVRRAKQQQIRERLRSASDKYAAMSAEAAAMHLEMSKRQKEEIQDFA